MKRRQHSYRILLEVLLLLAIVCIALCRVAADVSASRATLPKLRAPLALQRTTSKTIHAATILSDLSSPYYSAWAKTDEEDDEATAFEQLLSACYATATTLYGTTLLLCSKSLAGQIHIITMLRATGFDRIDALIQKIRRNIRDAKWSVLRNAPSFIQAKRSLQITARTNTGFTRHSKQDTSGTTRWNHYQKGGTTSQESPETRNSKLSTRSKENAQCWSKFG